MRDRCLTWMLMAAALAGCGPAKQTGGTTEDDRKVAAAAPRPGPSVRVGYAVLADVLHLVEGVSIWRQGMARTYKQAFDDFFGLDETDKKLLRKFAFARSELEERFAKQKAQPTFEAPFGPEGLFPTRDPSLVERFWERVMSAGQPAAVARALPGVMEPADAEHVAAALSRLAPRAGELIVQHGKFEHAIQELDRMLGQAGDLLLAFARFAGAEAATHAFQVHPVWAPERAAFEAVAYGDRILVAMPEGKPIGPGHGALAIHEMGRRLLSELPAEKKAMLTLRVVERAGRGQENFIFVEALLDALSHGLAAPLMATGPDQVPKWPGDERRKKLAEALTPLLRDYLAKGKRLDMAFVNRAAALQAKLAPPRPADFLDGAMVIGEDFAIRPFRSQVVRWTVWKFPPTTNYNYPRKFADNPGRSALLLFTPKTLRTLRARFQGVPGLLEAMRTAAGYAKREQPVVIAVPRQSRGYLFVLAAHSEEGMKKLAKAFFALKEIPAVPVMVE